MSELSNPPDWGGVEPRRRSKASGQLRSRLQRAERVEVPAATRHLAAKLRALDRQAARQERERRCQAALFLSRQLERRRRAEQLYQAARAAGQRLEPAACRRAGWRRRVRPGRSALASPAPLSASLSVSSVQLVMLDWPPPPPPPGRPRSSSAPSVLVDALWCPGQRHSHCLSPGPPRRRPLSGGDRPPAAGRRPLRDSFCRQLEQQRRQRAAQTPSPAAAPAESGDPLEARLRRTLTVVEKPALVAASRRGVPVR